MGRLIKDGTFFGTATSHREVAGVTLTESRYAPHQRIPPHAHRLPYLCVVLSGEFEEAAAGWRESCGPGTAVFHPTGEEHADRISPAGARCFNLQVVPALNARLESEAALPATREALAAGRATALAVALRTALKLDPAFTALAVEDALLAVLSQFSGAGGAFLRLERAPRWLGRAMERLHAADPPPVTVLAADAGVHHRPIAQHSDRGPDYPLSGLATRTPVERRMAATYSGSGARLISTSPPESGAWSTLRVPVGSL